MKISIIGTDHRLAKVELRELLAMSEDQVPDALADLVAISGIREAAVLSTCNRFEVVYVDEGSCDAELGRVLAVWAGLPADELEPHLIRYDGAEAARHLFSVTSSLDSMVLGESQITGQVKDAYRMADEAGTVGPLLHRLFHKAFAVAKRVRTDTDVGAASVSVAHAAVDMAQAVFEDLSRHSVLLLGAGEMAELALRGFRSRGVEDLWITNRTMARATEVASGLSAGVVPWAQRARFVERVDVVLCSTGARTPVLTRDEVDKARRARKGRPLLLIDISVPRNLDPRINELRAVYQFDIDDLAQAVQVNQEARKREAAKAGEMVDEEVGRFDRILSDVHVAPLLAALNRWVAAEGREEVERSIRNLGPVLQGLGDDERKAVELALGRMAGSLGKRFLHKPIRRLKELGAQGSVDRLADAAELLGVEATLLALDDGPDLRDSVEQEHDGPRSLRAGKEV